MRLLVVLICSALAAACDSSPAAPSSATPAPVAPQGVEDPDETAILFAIDQFFLTLGEGDPDKFEELHTSRAGSIVVTPEDDVGIRYRAVKELSEQMRNPGFPKIRERYWDPYILNRDDYAVVWTPYAIEFDDVRTHCGVTIFRMTKHGANWMVDSVDYTIEPSSCDEIKPGENSIIRPDFTTLDEEES